jgi:hypothetical protein
VRRSQFQPGFRLSFLDVLVLALGVFGSIYCWPRNGLLGFVIAFVVGHFFIFCNVFRLARGLEVLWASVFLIATLLALRSYDPLWMTIAIPSLIVTVIVIGIEIRKPSYHGVGWSRINPGLREWWEANCRH